MRYKVNGKVNGITFIRNNTLDDFINVRDVNNIEYIRFGSYISLYELLMFPSPFGESIPKWC